MNASRCGPLRAFSTSPAPTTLAALARPTPAPSRPFTTTRPRRGIPTTTPRKFGPPRKEPRTEPSMPPPYRGAPTIMLAEPGRGLTGPHKTAHILRALDGRVESLREVAPGEGGVPICRIFDLHAEAQAKTEREAREKEREKSRVRHKILEVTWAIANNDLRLKMARMEKFIRDGNRVELVLVRRNKARYVKTEDCEVLLGKVREAIGAVEGAREARKPDGAMGRTLKLFVEKAETKKGGEKKGDGEKEEEGGAGDESPQEGAS